jgi:hypothetical protein
MSLEGKPFAVILLVGPDQIEVERARDTVESLSSYEGTRFSLYLVDDDLRGRSLGESIAPELLRQRRVIELVNPRRGQGCGWGSGAAAGVLAALAKIAGRQDLSFVVKLDTDSLVINEFSEQVAAKFEELPQVGILGTYQFNPARMKDRSSAPACEKLLRQFTVWRRTPAGGPAVQMAFWGKYKRRRQVLRQAILNGYRLGEHCAGGGYAMSLACARALHAQGWLGDPLLWLQVPLGEDSVSALLAAAAGYQVKSFDREGEPFAIRHFGLPDTPERLVQRRHSIIHSVKDHGAQKEEILRSYFRERRKQTVDLEWPDAELATLSGGE